MTRLVAALIVTLSAAPADAAMIYMAHLTGNITRFDDSLGRFADVKVGDTVSGYFRYSTDPAAWGFVGISGDYRNFQTTNPNTAIWDMLISVSTATTTITSKDNGEPLFLFGVQLQDNPITGAPFDSLALSSYQGNIFQPTPVVTEVGINFRDLNGQLFTGSGPPSSINFSNADQRIGQFAFLVDTDGDGNRETRSFVEFSIDSLHPVPAPPAIMLLLSGAAVAFPFFRRVK